MSKYKLNKKCIICNKNILDKNKTGFCNKHRDRTGKNNPFYGKKHTIEYKEKARIRSSISTKKLWQDPEYRNKVIKGTSKPRREKFKQEQSERITQWYIDNPEQREIRREKMKESWKNGKITPNKRVISNKSKKEKKLFLKIKRLFINADDKCTIHSETNWFLPDIYIEDINLIIEFKGNYWHANPKYYNEDDIVHHNIIAKDIWEKDNLREKELEKLGYEVFVVWEDDYDNDINYIIKNIDSYNWESCSI